MAEVADLKITTTESIFLNGYYRDAGTSYTITNVKGIDNRIVEIPSGSSTELLKFTSSLAGASAGTIQSSALAYLRLSNLEATGSVYLNFIGSESSSNAVKLTPGTSHTISNTYMSGSTEEIVSLSVYVGGDSTGSKNIEYFLATR